jgi:hypothetical protein
VQPEWVELLRGRKVTLVFDADAAGRRAARRWHAALQGVAAEVHITWPDGDLCETINPTHVLSLGEPVNEPSGFIVEREDGLAPPDPASQSSSLTRAFTTVSAFILVRERLTIVAGQHPLTYALILRLLESVVQVSLGCVKYGNVTSPGCRVQP